MKFENFEKLKNLAESITLLDKLIKHLDSKGKTDNISGIDFRFQSGSTPLKINTLKTSKRIFKVVMADLKKQHKLLLKEFESVKA